jgi:serine protease Do
MSTRSVILAVVLVSLGIVFGVILVSGLKGVGVSFAVQDVTIGSQKAPPKANTTLKALNDAFQEIARNVNPTVVYITVKTDPEAKDSEEDGGQFFHRFFGPEFRMPRRGPELGAGSGVILTSDGYVLTNNHVVENAASNGITVRLLDTREYQAKLIGTDPYTDLAVIKVQASDLPVAALGNSDQVEVGHIVFAFGNPLGLSSTMTQGIVSALGRQIRIIDDQNTGYGIENFIQTDAAVNPGNSGGALVDVNGTVIGINTAIATTNARYQGYSFAIPINLAKKVATDLIKYGKVRRGFIGVQIQNVDAVTAKAAGLEKAQGVIVQGINKNSAGEAAGLQLGDIILSVDGVEVNTANALQSVVASRYPGETVTLKVYRNKKSFEKKVTLKPRDDEETTVAASDAPSSRRPDAEPSKPSVQEIASLGLTVRGLDDRTKKANDVERGVLIEEVEPFGPANSRGLVKGDVILSVGERPVQNPGEFKDEVDRLKAGDAVMLRVKGSDKRVRYVAVEKPR